MNLREAVSVGSAIVVGAGVVLNAPLFSLPIAFASGVAAAVIVGAVLFKYWPSLSIEATPLSEVDESENLPEYVGEAERDLTRIRLAAMHVADTKVATLLREICDVGDQIIIEINDKPEQAHLVKLWQSTELTLFRSIIMGYVSQGQSKKVNTDKLMAVLMDVKKNFDNNLRRVRDNKTLNLEVEIKLLKSLLEETKGD